MMRPAKLKILVLAGLAVTGGFASTSRGLISSLATEGFTVTGSYPGGNTIVAIGGPVTNSVGGYAFYGHNTTGGSNQTYFVFGNASAGSKTILATQAAVPFGTNTLSDYAFAGIGGYSLANDGSVLYTMTSTRVNNAAPSVDALLLKTPSSSTPSVIAYDGEQVGGSSAYSTKYLGYNQSTSSIATLAVPKLTAGGSAYFFIDGVSNTYGGSQTGMAIFTGAPGGGATSIVLKNGDSIAGAAGQVVGSGSGSIDTSNFGISAGGINYIDQVTTNTGSTLIVTGTPGGGATKLLAVGATAVGGMNNEVWTSFSRSSINDVGTSAVVGAVSSGGYALAVNGVVQFESGSTIPVGGGGTVTLGTTTSPNPDVKINDNGDYATVYADYPPPGPGTQAKGKLIFDGVDIGDTGTLIDTDGDGIPDTALASVNPGRGVTVGDLQSNGTIDVYFFGSISGSSANILLRDRILIGDANLDGKIDGSDYSRIDNGFLQHLTGWYNGDFNHDGVVNGSDYTLIDNEFNTQPANGAAQIAGELATPTNEIAAATSVPEPASLAFFAVSAAALLGSRRTEKSSSLFKQNLAGGMSQPATESTGTFHLSEAGCGSGRED
jgi:hypothetical protein